MTGVFIAGRGLACALGDSLDECLASLRRSQGYPPHNCPPFALRAADTGQSWSDHARQLILSVAEQAGYQQARDGALLIASASAEIGAVEAGEPWAEDALVFAEQIAAWLDWRGPLLTVSTACTSAINALLAARSLMASGAASEALVLGLELPNRYTQAGFEAMQLLSASAPQPLGSARDGLVLGEAVAALRLSTQPARWALSGGACRVAARDATGASAESVAQCWQDALANSGLAAEDIDVIKLQASGSPASDQAEVDGLAAVFAQPAALCSLKAHLGHSLGACGAAEIALLSAMLETDLWPRHAHALQPGPSLASQAPARTERWLASIIGFGGSHTALVLEQGAASAAPQPAPSQCFEVSAVHIDWQTPWREHLAELCGHRPRRIGELAEFAVYGALRCLAASGEGSLPAGAILRLCSLRATRPATETALAQLAQDGLIMPFSFLQSQAGQVLAALAQQLQWEGDGRLISSRSPRQLIELACLEAGPAGALIGWTDSPHPGHPDSRSSWLRLRPAQAPSEARFQLASDESCWQARFLRLAQGRLEYA